jgi:hypothetical protein
MSYKMLGGVALGSALLVTTVVCVASAAKASGDGVLQQVAERTAKVDTMTSDVTVDTRTSQGRVSLHETGEVRLHPSLAESLSMDPISMGGQTVPASKIVLIDGYLYVRNPMIAQRAGKPWVKASLADVGKKAGFDLAALFDHLKKESVAQQARMLAASTDVHQVGTEPVDGRETTHYAGTLHMEDALRRVDGDLRADLERQVRSFGLDKINFELWVDRDFLPRKQVIDEDTRQGHVSVTARFTSYDQPVDIQAPPPSEVADSSSLTG